MRMKRLMSAFLALVMVMSMVTVPASAEDTISCTKTTGCTLAEDHTGECSVPTEPSTEPVTEPQVTTYCDNESCLLHKTEAHTVCQYCDNEKCTLQGEAHTQCQVPQETTAPSEPTCTCADKCVIDAKNAECEACKDATADTLSTVCTGKEPVYEDCDAEGCDQVKGHDGDHTGAGNFAECDGEITPDACDADSHNPGCSMFKVTDETTLKAALEGGLKAITLEADVTLNNALSVGDGVEINLNTKTLYVNVENSHYGNATIKNGNIVLGKDDVHVCDGYFLIDGGKKLTLNGVKMTSPNGMKAYTVFHLYTGADLELTGCEININNNEYAGSIVYGESIENAVTISGTSITGENVGRGFVYGNITLSNNSSVTLKGTTEAGLEHGFNRSQLTVEDSHIEVTGGTGRGITAEIGDIIVKGNSTVNISDMGEATIELRGDKNLSVEDTAKVTVDKSVNNTTNGTVTVAQTASIVVVSGEAVAKDSAGTLYSNLQTAVNAGGIITVLYDHEVTETVTIPEGKTVTLDLNGKTVTLPGIENNGTLTVKNGTLNGNAYQDVIVSYGELTVDDVTASGTRHVLRIKKGTATIEGGTFTALGTAGTTCHVLNVGDDDTNATVIVNGGTFVGAEGKGVDSTAAISVQNESKVTVKGGNFSKGMSGSTVDLFLVAENANLELTGGTYDADVNAFCAADYKATIADSKTWNVVAKDYVAQIGEDKYESIQAAVDAAGQNDTITLIADEIVLDKSETIEVAKKVTIDLNGKTINAGGDAFTVVDGGDLTINGNGTVKAGTAADGSYCAVWTNGGGEVTINGGTYSVGAKSGDYNDLIYAKGGSITITGGYFNSENTQWSNNGKYYVLNQNNTNPGTITVSGGTFENYDPAEGDDSVEDDTFLASGFCSAAKDDGKTYTVAQHKLVRVPAVKATCQSDGNIEHYKCDNCGKLYDAAQNGKELTGEEVVIAGGKHDLAYQAEVPATYDADGIKEHYYCEIEDCGEKFEDVDGEVPFEGSTVIEMLSHVEGNVLVIDPEAIENEGKKNVVLDLTQKVVMGSLKEVIEVEFQTACLEDHVDREGTLRVVMSDGEVYFDNDALATIVDAAEGATVTLVVDEITKTDSGLTAKQKTTLNGKKDPYIIRLQLWSNGKRITDDFDGKVYVYLTGFEPKTGYKASSYSAFFLDEDGTTDSVSYYSRDVRLTVEHFSEYFLARNAKAASNAATGDTSNVLVWGGVGLAAVAALVVLLILNRKKKGE